MVNSKWSRDQCKHPETVRKIEAEVVASEVEAAGGEGRLRTREMAKVQLSLAHPAVGTERKEGAGAEMIL